MRKIKALAGIVVILLACLACRIGAPTVSVVVTSTVSPSPSPAPEVLSKSVVEDDVLSNAFTLCVTAEEGVWLRSKPWATSALNIPNALLAGTKVEVYLSPYGAHEWLEVWVPSEGVTGYVNTNYVGSCKDD